jgi:tetratricopeptide (TPR) repeat protein
MKLGILIVIAVSCQIALSQTPTPTPSPIPSDALIKEVTAQNAKAARLNAIITVYNAAVVKKDWPAAAESAKQLIALDPRPAYYLPLGGAQLNSGKYDDAIATYKTFLQLSGYPAAIGAADDKTKASIGLALANTGNAYIKLRNYTEATKNYELAAAIDPNPGLAWFNLCATQYNLGNSDAAIPSCRKAVAADPARADAWFVLGSALYGNGKIDAAGKYVLPAGTIEALKKYLELAPTGPHAADVKAMLDAIP